MRTEFPVTIFLVVFCCFLLQGCGGSGGGGTPPADFRPTVEQAPQSASDEAGNLWMAFLTRTSEADAIQVVRVEDGRRREVALLSPEGATGLAHPAIAALKSGCIVAFSVEKNGQWCIAYAVVGNTDPKPFDIHFLPCEGSVNIAPAVAGDNDRVCLVWESNAGGGRGIYACLVEPNHVGEVKRLSSAAADSSNPSIVALEGGDFFAAWDSYEREEANIYGAWLKAGGWEAAIQLTSDPRIERYPFLATRNGEIWLCWQAQSYQGRALNALKEQRIVVARLAGGRLETPLGFFEAVSPPDRLLMRPRIFFDSLGGLWLTARLGMENFHGGWLPVAWNYRGDSWSAMTVLSSDQGRWQPVPLMFGSKGEVSAAVQSDDLPKGWDNTRGVYPDWQSVVHLIPVVNSSQGPAPELITEALVMPPTSFSLAAKSASCSADLPRQQWHVGSRTLQLYWGDLHDHTDISVCNRRFNPPGKDLFANLRDIEKLDFAALTDHGYNFDRPQWRLNGEQTRYSNDPGKFITFLGEEWTSSRDLHAGGYGHRNLIFLDPFFGRFFDAYDGDITPRAVWDQLEGTDFIAIPHQLADWEGEGNGNPPTDWDFTDEKLQPVAEIYQVRGSYECLGCPRQAPNGQPVRGNYLQDAWAKGIVIGVIASPDHDGGYGKAGVWAESLDRRSIFDAIRARHTFGTTGSKIGLEFSSGSALMGDRVPRPEGPLSFSVNVTALQLISEIDILRNNEVVFSAYPGQIESSFTWTDKNPFPRTGPLWYYLRVKTSNNELAWSSPIWFF